MNIFGKQMNNRYLIWLILHFFIIIDIILITIEMFLNLPANVASGIKIFDSCLCIVLLAEWCINFHISKPKKIFLKQKNNWIDLIASIPFDLILPALIPSAGLLRYLRLLRLLRIFALFNRFFNGFEKFIKKTNMDLILGGVFFTVIIFTLIFYVYGPSYGLFDDFYFVIVTLATVGYGDVTPYTYTEKVFSIVLIFAGIFVFSTITAAISSYFTDSLIRGEDEDIDKNFDYVSGELDDIKKDLARIHKENEELKQEIKELKELMKDD